MTKEKIIINGIDVTECTYRRQKPHNFCMCASVINERGNIIELTRYVQCECNPNCHFKQFKRKEQECEAFKNEIAFGNNGKLSDKIGAPIFKNLNTENLKYKQALDEIEINISEYQALTFDKPRTMRENDCIYNILDIINKVKEE